MPYGVSPGSEGNVVPLRTTVYPLPPQPDPVEQQYYNFSTLKQIQRQFTRGGLQSQAGQLKDEIRDYGSSEERRERLDAFDKRLEALGESGPGFTGLMAASSELIGQMTFDMLTPEGAARTAFGAGIGSIVPVVGTLAGAGIGAAAHLIMSSYEQSSGENYVALRELGVDRDEAYWVSGGVGAINAGFDAAGMALVAAPFKRLFKSQIARATQDPRFIAALGRGASAYGLAVGGESLTEGFQEMTFIAGEEFGKLLSEADVASITPEELYERVTGSMVKAAKGMVLLGLPGAAVTVADRRAARAANANRAKLEEAGELIDSLPPETKDQMVRDAVAESDFKEAWISAETLIELAQKDPTIYQKLGLAGAKVTQVEDSALFGGDIRFDAQVYGTLLQDPDLRGALADHIRHDPDLPSAAETKDNKTLELPEEDIDIDDPLTVFHGTTEAIDQPFLDFAGEGDLSAHSIDPTKLESTMRQVPTEAEVQLGLQALFQTAKDAGMTNLQYERYLVFTQRAADSRDAAKGKRRIREELAKNSGEQKAAREALRETATQSVSSQPLYQATLAIGRDRLDRDAVIRLVGEAGLKRLPKVNGRQVYRKNGVDPEVHADIYGLDGADVMLFSMMDNPTFEAAVESEVDRLYNEQHSGLDAKQRDLEAEFEALHNDSQAAVLNAELAALRAANKEKKISPRMVKLSAQRKLREFKLGDIKPKTFLIAERRAAKKAAQLLRKGDRAGASKAKFQQLVNFHMVMEAYRVTDKTKRQHKYFKKFLKRPKPNSALPSSFRDMILQLLGDAGEAPRVRQSVAAPSIESALLAEAESGPVSMPKPKALAPFLAGTPNHWPVAGESGLINLRRAEGVLQGGTPAALPRWFGRADKLVKQLATQFNVSPPVLWVATKDGTQFANAYQQSGGKQGVIVVADDLPVDIALASIIHEFGHHLDDFALATASQEVQAAIFEDWHAFYGKGFPDGMTLEDLRPLTARGVKTEVNAEWLDYATQFDEWFAEQVVTWISTNRKPTNLVESFFQGIADVWKKLYAAMTGNLAPQGQAVADFLEGAWRGDGARATEGSGEIRAVRFTGKRKEFIKVTRELEINDGIVIQIPLEVQSTLGKKHYLDLTLGEWETLYDHVRTVEKQGLDANRLSRAEAKETRDEIAAEVAAEIRTNLKSRAGEEVETTWETLKDAGREYRQLLFSADTILRAIDGLKSLGPAYRAIKQPYDRAMNGGYLSGSVGFLQRQQKAIKDIGELMNVFTKAEQVNRKKKVFIVPGLKKKVSREHVLSVMLNLGNPEGRQALLDSRIYTEAQLEAIVGFATEKDVKFVQSVWDFFETFWPEVRDSSIRRRNLDPEKVQHIPLETKFGTLKGGYYPLSYDEKQSIIQTSVIAADPAAMLDMIRGGVHTTMMTRHGHTKAREGPADRKVKLNLHVINNHVDQVVYDLEVGDALIDVYKILNHKEVRNAFTDQGRKQTWEQLEVWFSNVVVGEMTGGGYVEKGFKYFRTGATVSKLGFSATTAALQLTGLAQSAVAVGKWNMFNGMRLAVNYPAAANFARTQSPFMASRAESFSKDINEAQNMMRDSWLRKWTPGESANRVLSLGFWGVVKLQGIVDVATWMAGQRDGMKLFGDAVKAAEHADGIVRRAQGSGVFGDRTAVDRGSFKKGQQTELARTFVPFISYFLAKTNVAVERVRRTDIQKGRPIHNAIAVADLAFDMMLLYMFDAVIAAWIYGEFPEDEEDLPKFLAIESALSVLGGIPILRGIASEMQGFEGGGTVASMMSEGGRFGVQIQQLEMDEALARSAARFLGTAARVPGTSQMIRTGGAAMRQMNREDVQIMEYVAGPGWRED